MTSEYERGYAAGWRAVRMEAEGRSLESADLALDEVAAQRAREARHEITDEQMGDYWLGYYHGRGAQRRDMEGR
ncbi:MAG: hypothetical protein KGK07_12865 [Chloroflexota bacterium]|nr:hypothetical protein [Chloroflexota bacterium]